jgi:N-acetylglucosamine-6-phosphate deacetylase
VTAVQQITGRDPLTGEGICLTVKYGVIIDVRPDADSENSYLSPGLIDLQVNGYCGLDLNDGQLTSEKVVALCKKLVSLGVTGFLPTLITGPESQYIDALTVIRQTREEHWLVHNMIVGVHMEGPSISPIDGPRGAHPLEHVRAPSLKEFDGWQAASGGLVAMVTIAPEQPGALDYIRALSGRGVHLAIGHTAATVGQIHAAAEAGASLSTHLGNGVANTLPRHPNLLWAQLADDRLTASFIADRHHLTSDTFTAMLRSKSLKKTILVSDSVALAGMPAGRYSSPIGKDVEVGKDGRVVLYGTPYLAGAGLPLAANVPIAMHMAGLTLAEALMLATHNPGRFVDRSQDLTKGARADILRFNLHAEAGGQLEVVDVWVAGEKVAYD